MLTIKTDEEIAVMRQAGRILAQVLKRLEQEVGEGIKTKELDGVASRETRRMGVRPSFKGYNGFPASLCVSVNDEIVHGIPGERVLRRGDIVSLDFGVIYQGFQADAAITVGVGEMSPEARALIEVTEGALEAGIGAAYPEAYLGDISAAVQEYAESRGFSVIREYTGHGIGRQMHEDPLVPNFGIAGRGLLLKEGMTLAIEPMLSLGDWRTRVGADGWVVHTADGSLSAHFEHTIAITKNGPEVLTIMDDGHA